MINSRYQILVFQSQKVQSWNLSVQMVLEREIKIFDKGFENAREEVAMVTGFIYDINKTAMNDDNGGFLRC